MTLDLTSRETIVKGLEAFIDTMANRPVVFKEGLKAANIAYSQERLIKEILDV